MSSDVVGARAFALRFDWLFLKYRPEFLAFADGQPFNRFVVMSFRNTDAIRAEILASGVPMDRVFWL